MKKNHKNLIYNQIKKIIITMRKAYLDPPTQYHPKAHQVASWGDGWPNGWEDDAKNLPKTWADLLDDE